MKILAIDTSTDTASAAVMCDNTLLGEYALNHKKTHSQKIMVMVDRLLSDLELSARDIDIFASSSGPGSFTGIRIGVETVKALAHGVGADVVGVCTLEALAYGARMSSGAVVPLLDARGGRLYAGAYRFDGEQHEIIAPCDTTVEECGALFGGLDNVTLIGSGASAYKKRLAEIFPSAKFAEEAESFPRAAYTAEIALERAKRGEVQSYLELKPFYIKKSQAEKDLEKKNA